jgi:hypothetical protein
MKNWLNCLLLAIWSFLDIEPALAITWCHDYSLYKISGQDANETSPSMLRRHLREMNYKRFLFTDVAQDPSTLARLEPGDVIIIGEDHSGVVNAKNLIDHYIQKSGKEKTSFLPEQLPSLDNFYRDWTLLQLILFERVTPDGRKIYPYEGKPLEVWRKRPVGKLILLEPSLEVLDPQSRTYVAGQTQSTPTSTWKITESDFIFRSTKDGFQLEISWDPMPKVIEPFQRYGWEVQASIKGPRGADIALTPIMNTAVWKITLAKPIEGVNHPGVNTFRLHLNGEPGKPVLNSGKMRLEITVVGQGAQVKPQPPNSTGEGEITGGTGYVVVGREPDQYDAIFLELQCNGLAKIGWAYVLENSPLLKKKAADEK